jgi:hypothetical protein
VGLPDHERPAIDELPAAARARLRRLTPAQTRDAARIAAGLIVDIRSEHQRESQAQRVTPG